MTEAVGPVAAGVRRGDRGALEAVCCGLLTGAGSRAIPLHSGKSRHEVRSLGIYLAYSAPDVSLERPTPVVIVDTPDVTQRLFHRGADVVESRKPLRPTLMPVHHTHHRPS